LAHIRKRSNGTYQALVYVGLSAETSETTGKPIKLYESITCDEWKECKNLARDLEKDISDGLYSNMRNLLFSDYADRWLKLNENMVASTTYIKNYKMPINKHLKPFFGRFKLKDINEFHVKEYINNKLSTLSPSTVRKHFFTLSKMLYDVLKGKSPCKDIAPPEEATYIPVVPTDDEFNLLYAAIKGTFDEPIVLLAGWCGLREGEIFGLKTDDIDEINNTIRIDESRAIYEIKYEPGETIGPKLGYEDKDPKSKKGFRTLAVKDYLMELLKKVKNEQISKARKNKKVIDMSKEPIYLFNMRPDSYSSRFSNIINYHNEMVDLKKKFGQAGLDNYLKSHTKKSIRRNISLQCKKIIDTRFHDLRHYHVTVMYENDIPDQYAADRLGDDIKTMKAVYQHLRLEKRIELDVKIKNI